MLSSNLTCRSISYSVYSSRKMLEAQEIFLPSMLALLALPR